MAIKLICPRCKTGLQVPAKLLGQYTQCPACQNRILIPPQPPPGSVVSDATGDTEAGRSATAAIALQPSGGAAGAAPANAPPVPVQTSAYPPGAAPSVRAAWASGTGTPAGSAPGSAGRSVSMPAAWSGHAAPEPAAPRKVARFITADSAPSTVQLAPGGELPTLRLAEGAQSGKSGPGASKMNPLVLVGAACLSFCLCVVLLLADFDTTVDSARDADVRTKLEAYYKNQEGPLEPYQVHLREAQQARSRGDRQAEWRHYRRVLDLLHAERDPRDRFRGLTGTPQSDQNLEKLLASLLAGGSSDAGDESN